MAVFRRLKRELSARIVFASFAGRLCSYLNTVPIHPRRTRPFMIHSTLSLSSP